MLVLSHLLPLVIYVLLLASLMILYFDLRRMSLRTEQLKSQLVRRREREVLLPACRSNGAGGALGGGGGGGGGGDDDDVASREDGGGGDGDNVASRRGGGEGAFVLLRPPDPAGGGDGDKAAGECGAGDGANAGMGGGWRSYSVALSGDGELLCLEHRCAG